MAHTDPQEAELMAEVARRRDALIAQGEMFQKRLIEKFDPRELVRRHPLQSALAAVAAGILLSFLPRGWNRETRSERAGTERGGVFGSLLLGILPEVLTAVLGPLVPFLSHGLPGSRPSVPAPGDSRH